MRALGTAGGWAATLLLLGFAACDVPTDESSSLGVSVSPTSVRVLVGASATLSVQVEGGGLGAEEVAFSSRDEDVARVSEQGVVLGVGVGETVLDVRLRRFESAASDSVMVDVQQNLSFERVTPAEARFGALITAVGRGLDPANLSVLSIGGFPVSVESLVPASSADPGSRDTLRLFVPAGAGSETSLVALHENGATDFFPMRIEPRDVWEPNDDAPAVLNDPFDLTNPQLAHEAGGGYDWYRLRNVDRDLTLEVRYGFPLELVIGGIEVMPPRKSRSEAPDWSIADSEEPWCRGLRVPFERAYFLNENASDDVFFFPLRGVRDSVDVVFAMFSPPAFHRRYQVRVLDGAVYGAPPDAHEPNDHCGIATAIATPFTTTLSVDSPYDYDWFRFTLDETSRVEVEVDCVSCREDDVSAFADVTLYADRAPRASEVPGRLPLIRNGFSSGGAFSFAEVLEPGDYLLMFGNSFTDPLAEVAFAVSWNPVSAVSPAHRP